MMKWLAIIILSVALLHLYQEVHVLSVRVHRTHMVFVPNAALDPTQVQDWRTP